MPQMTYANLDIYPGETGVFGGNPLSRKESCGREYGGILQVNRWLDSDESPYRINENALDGLWSSLQCIGGCRCELYWLTLARLTELGLWCAGQYADSGEVQSAGDLLLNPRKKALHIKGRSEPLKLKRHGKITEQAIAQGAPAAEVIDWIKKNTVLTTEKALLPMFHQRLKKWNQAPKGYMDSVLTRMNQVADAIRMIVGLRMPKGRSLPEHLRLADPCEREFIMQRLCSFNLDRFYWFGDRLKNIAEEMKPGGFQDQAA